MRTLSEQACFDGVMGYYAHPSSECGVEMRVAVYRPPRAERGPVPVVTYLAGLGTLNQAAMGKDVQDTTGAQFRVIDPPRVNPDPVGPNRPALLSRLIIATGDVASPQIRAFIQRTRRPVLEKPFELSTLAALVERVTAGN